MKTNSARYYALPRGHERSALVKRANTVVAEVFTDREPGDQYQTAHLYAAAPAMLAALQTLQTMGLGREAYAICTAVISQAQQGQ